MVSFATISVRLAASAALKAATLPPPGAGEFDAIFSRNSFMVSSANIMKFKKIFLSPADFIFFIKYEIAVFNDFFHATYTDMVGNIFVRWEFKDYYITCFTHINASNAVCPVNCRSAIYRQRSDCFFDRNVHIESGQYKNERYRFGKTASRITISRQGYRTILIYDVPASGIRFL